MKMKIQISSRTLFLLGFLLLVLTNIVVLVGVLVNRSGEPESMITLTERELPLAYHSLEENSSIELNIEWRAQIEENHYGWYDHIYSYVISPTWLTVAKLKELGFKFDDNLEKIKESFFYDKTPREVFIVLEYDGMAYRDSLQKKALEFEKKKALFQENSDDEDIRRKYEEIELYLKAERESYSKLLAIDAGLDPRKLRAIYKDRGRYIIANGLVTWSLVMFNNELRKIEGRILRLSVENVNVSRKLRQELLASASAGEIRKNNPLPAHYRVKLAYGSRFEPWIVAIEPTTQVSPE